MPTYPALQFGPEGFRVSDLGRFCEEVSAIVPQILCTVAGRSFTGFYCFTHQERMAS